MTKRQSVLGGVVVVAALLAGVTAQEPPPQLARVEVPSAAALTDVLNSMTFDTGSLACNGTATYLVANPYPHAIFIRKVRRWMGTSYGSIIDVNNNLYVNNPEAMKVVDGPWDRYDNPSQPHTEEITFNPEPMMLVAGGWFAMNVSCAHISGPTVPWQPPATHQHALDIYFLKNLPD